MSFLPLRTGLLSLTLLLLTACAQNTVPLVYTPPEGSDILSANAPQVTVVPFRDARSRQEIGQRSDGSPFIASSNVAAWVSHSFASELSQRGILVSFAETEEQARTSGAVYVASGVVEEVWLTEQSSTSYQCAMRGTVVLKDTRSTLLNNSFSGSLSRRVVPMSSVPQEMLTETVGDLAVRMAQATQQKLGSR